MADFHEVRFPTSISKGSSGGPRRRTDVVTLRSGYEERNAVWADSRREYDAGLGIRNINDMHDVLAFFEARLGRLYGFRWKDWADYKSCPPMNIVAGNDQTVGIPLVVGEIQQITKRYSSGPTSYTRVITKPIVSTIIAEYAGFDVTGDILVDETSGQFRLLRPIVPGEAVYLGFEFDVPVRFVNDYIDVNVEQFNAGSLPQLNAIEIKIPSSVNSSLAVSDELLALVSSTPVSVLLELYDRVNLAVNTEWEASE